MAVTTIPVKYETSDGKEFDSQQEAERHEDLITTRNGFENARQKFGNALAKSQRTADGKLFDFNLWGDYFHVDAGYWGMPDLSRVSFYGWNYEFDYKDEFVIRQPRGDDRSKWVEYRISTLYASEAKANIALLAARKEWLRTQAEKIEEFEAELMRKLE